VITFTDLAALEISHEHLHIRPYRSEDFAGLSQIFDPSLFTWFFKSYSQLVEFVDEKLEEYAKQNLVMLVLLNPQTGPIIGTTSLYEISLRHHRLEMGSTWLGHEFQGSYYNALAKYLLIDHLTNHVGFHRIQWKTDALNQKSANAMQKLGLVYEGTLRRHAITDSGRVRDSLVFAVTDLDWPTVKVAIAKRINQKSGTSIQL
jgi:RimJ/RimL family protein N-acetyltransferase